MVDLTALRYQLDVELDVRDPRFHLLANVLLDLVSEIETLRQQVQELQAAAPPNEPQVQA